MQVMHAKPLQYVEMEPAPDVSHLAVAYWGFAVHALPHPGFTHHVWPDGCVTLVLAFLNGRSFVSIVSGPSTTAIEVPIFKGEQFWGIRFRPESGAAFCNRSAESLRDARLPAGVVFGNALQPMKAALRTTTDAELVRNLFDEWMREREVEQHHIDSLVRDAVREIVACDGLSSMQSVADGLGVTLRQLQRRFRASTGLTPKEYAIIRRARGTLKRLAMGLSVGRVGGWARLAHESGFADQAHLTRECSRLLALTPSVLMTRIDDIAHGHIVD